MDPAWGPAVAADPGPVLFGGAAIEGVAVAGGEVARTSAPTHISARAGQTRRFLEASSLRAVHIVFGPRPGLLGDSGRVKLALVRFHNTSSEPARVDYTETWDVGNEGEYAAYSGTCERRSETRVRVLAEVSAGIRAVAPETTPGLALDVRILLPPRAVRELAFVFVADVQDGTAEATVRAWRGRVRAELAKQP